MADRDQMAVYILASKDISKELGLNFIVLNFKDADKLVEMLKEQPEQKHGHWKLVQDYYDDEHWQCSACGREWYLEAGNPEENDMHYCPECGAKMNEKVKQ